MIVGFGGRKKKQVCDDVANYVQSGQLISHACVDKLTKLEVLKTDLELFGHNLYLTVIRTFYSTLRKMKEDRKRSLSHDAHHQSIGNLFKKQKIHPF